MYQGILEKTVMIAMALAAISTVAMLRGILQPVCSRYPTRLDHESDVTEEEQSDQADTDDSLCSPSQCPSDGPSAAGTHWCSGVLGK